MLLWLAQQYQDQIGALRVFNFITFRAVFATLTALLIGLLSGPAVIRMLTRLKVGQAVRTDGPQTHLIKSGTPTMGGALILIGIGVSTLLWGDWSNRFMWPVLIVTLGFGAIGWVDDYRKVVYKDPNGMASREKYFWQSLIGLTAAFYLAFSVSGPTNMKVWALFLEWVQSGFEMSLPPKADLIVPFFKTVSYPLGVWGFIALTYFVIVGTSNAVNLTDGLDGLAIMPTVMVGSALGLFAYLAGSATYAKYLLIPHIPGAGELIIFCGAMAGAGLYGGCWRARFGWRAGHHRRDRPSGDRAFYYGRCVRGGDLIGDAASGLFQVHQNADRCRQAGLADGAAASSF